MTPFERVLRCHDCSSCSSFLSIITDQLSFLQQNRSKKREEKTRQEGGFDGMV
jgi:hypothetical protein